MPSRRQEALDYHAQDRPGKIQVSPTKPFKNQRDLSLAYTPGVEERRTLDTSCATESGARRPSGPILVGMAQPVHVLHRGAEVNGIVNLAVIAAVDALEHRRHARPTP